MNRQNPAVHAPFTFSFELPVKIADDHFDRAAPPRVARAFGNAACGNTQPHVRRNSSARFDRIFHRHGDILPFPALFFSRPKNIKKRTVSYQHRPCFDGQFPDKSVPLLHSKTNGSAQMLLSPEKHLLYYICKTLFCQQILHLPARCVRGGHKKRRRVRSALLFSFPRTYKSRRVFS